MTMSVELKWMLLTVLMTGLLWMPHFLDRIAKRGLLGAIKGTTAEVNEPHSDWGRRAMRAHQNAVENLVLFAPAALSAHLLHVSTPVTQGAVVVYFFARLAHFVVYALGIPLGRTLTFTAGWAATMAILASLLGWL
jgi:uncharacterized MAPEG superfamily protein